ncbi:hypothetical protein RFI_04049 [Reticulomyxa filosa]|uniref:MIT domain-containing protein n=1 Tax=Reticulomyxa filosa TaxID=46433 RepID=X6P4L0_RETFI|nr:hypothetical protein RFI_04049 [Reticulomyxa filosa]|eukprot:ETO33058.1 hypothetical protein RFI_04049 [Reticulomyxa filosa]
MQLAEEKERTKEKEEAFELYQQGLQFMIEALRSIPLSSLKQKRQQIVNAYLNHAEVLKKVGELYGDKAPPSKKTNENLNGKSKSKKMIGVSGVMPSTSLRNRSKPKSKNDENDSKTSSYESELHQRIENEIIHSDLNVRFEDIVGLEDVKQALLEAVILPAQRPDLFTGPRKPPKGLLLFGPPGNGKTFIAKACLYLCIFAI